MILINKILSDSDSTRLDFQFTVLHELVKITDILVSFCFLLRKWTWSEAGNLQKDYLNSF